MDLQLSTWTIFRALTLAPDHHLNSSGSLRTSVHTSHGVHIECLRLKREIGCGWGLPPTLIIPAKHGSLLRWWQRLTLGRRKRLSIACVHMVPVSYSALNSHHVCVYQQVLVLPAKLNQTDHHCTLSCFVWGHIRCLCSATSLTTSPI